MILHKRKSISWKSALGIVICLHLFGYVAVSQYSSYRKKLAQELKEKKELLYSQAKFNPKEWARDPSAKPQVFYPPPKQPMVKQENKKFNIDFSKNINLVTDKWNIAKKAVSEVGSTVYDKIKEIKFDDLNDEKTVDFKKFVNNVWNTNRIESAPPKKEIVKTTIKQTPQKITIQPKTSIPLKPVVAKQTSRPKVPKPIATPPPKPSQYAVSKPNIATEIPSYITEIAPRNDGKPLIRNVIIESDGQIRETTETRQIISSHIVLR
jgi:hypothetical protein